MKKLVTMCALLVVFSLMGFNLASAGDAGTKEEAVAMVKKAIEYIKQNGEEKAFAEISNPQGQFVDRDLYVNAFDMNGKCLAHGANAKQIGRVLIDNKDIDGKEYIKERIALMQAQTTGWQDYKFRNPVTNEVEPKTMYIERHGDKILGCGAYKTQ